MRIRSQVKDSNAWVTLENVVKSVCVLHEKPGRVIWVEVYATGRIVKNITWTNDDGEYQSLTHEL